MQAFPNAEKRKERRVPFHKKLCLLGWLFSLFIALIAIAAPEPGWGQALSQDDLDKYFFPKPLPQFYNTYTDKSSFANGLWESTRDSFSGKCLLALGAGAGAAMKSRIRRRN
ncbi:hypothetical protein CEE39_04075 [bacterium (candidate division B38) B3_B38]|nr:MAG: hypothetical protein CEE39_04075 [bacterium (candidate division B38) B3_B38]